MKDAYQHLDNLIGGYLNQDFSYYADTLEGVIEAYIADEGKEQVQRVLSDITLFLHHHQSDTLEQAFEDLFCADFDPKLFGLTAGGFLKKLDEQLRRGTEP